MQNIGKGAKLFPRFRYSICVQIPTSCLPLHQTLIACSTTSLCHEFKVRQATLPTRGRWAATCLYLPVVSQAMPSTISNGFGPAPAADQATLWAQLQSITAQLQATAADKAGLAAQAEAVAAAKAELAQQVRVLQVDFQWLMIQSIFGFSLTGIQYLYTPYMHEAST